MCMHVFVCFHCCWCCDKFVIKCAFVWVHMNWVSFLCIVHSFFFSLPFWSMYSDSDRVYYFFFKFVFTSSVCVYLCVDALFKSKRKKNSIQLEHIKQLHVWQTNDYKLPKKIYTIFGKVRAVKRQKETHRTTNKYINWSLYSFTDPSQKSNSTKQNQKKNHQNNNNNEWKISGEQ